jgi:hypothetical protein
MQILNINAVEEYQNANGSIWGELTLSIPTWFNKNKTHVEYPDMLQ